MPSFEQLQFEVKQVATAMHFDAYEWHTAYDQHGLVIQVVRKLAKEIGRSAITKRGQHTRTVGWSVPASPVDALKEWLVQKFPLLTAPVFQPLYVYHQKTVEFDFETEVTYVVSMDEYKDLRQGDRFRQVVYNTEYHKYYSYPVRWSRRDT